MRTLTLMAASLLLAACSTATTDSSRAGSTNHEWP